MVNEMYAIMAFVALVSAFIFGSYCHKNKEEDITSKDFKNLLVYVGVFCFIDMMWGVIGTGKLIQNKDVFYYSSVAFHLAASMTAYIWCRYGLKYMNTGKDAIYHIILMIPFAVAVVLIIFNFFGNVIFYIDDDYIYHSQKFRLVLFIAQYIYFAIVMVIAVIKIVRSQNEYKRHRYNIVFMFNISTVLFGFLQYKYPDVPFYSCGYMIGIIAIFIGNIATEREKSLTEMSDFYKNESIEKNNALESLAESYVSIHLFNLEKNKQQSIHSNAFIDAFIDENDNAHDQIMKVMGGVSAPEYRDGIVRFVDTYDLSERMKDKNIISHEFLGLNQGWCMSHFIRVESGSKGELKKVIHAVQNIHEMKVREANYENALKEAYENKNFILAEMLKVQAGGVIATDTENNIIMMNDAAAHILGIKSQNEINNRFENILKRIEIDNYEQSVENFNNLVETGRSFTYYFTSKNIHGSKSYVMATAKLVKLKNGSKSVITTYADISKNKEMEERLITLSEIDALTGINNRGSGESKTELLLANGDAGMFCLIDVNKFKSINDSYGHNIGDKALMSIADSLRVTFRDRDIIMRLGGDEFAVFAKGVISRDAARRVIMRFFRAVDNIEIPEMKGDKITVSLGVAFSSDLVRRKFDEIYQMADAVMYRCKKNLTGNNFDFYDKATDSIKESVEVKEENT